MTTQSTVELDVLLEFRDYMRANYWFLFRRAKWVIVMLFFLGVVYPLLLVSLLESLHESDKWWGFFIPLGLLAFLFGGTYFSSKKQMT